MWYRLSQYKPAASRAMVGDSFDWHREAQCWNGQGAFPQQKLITNIGTVYPSSQGTRGPGTTFDYYRHGKYPTLAGPGSYFRSSGGKIAFNILYADGHVLMTGDRAEAYRSMFQMFPYVGPEGRPNTYSD
jgi:prepilin-type processing-associated H-X9-DG protein